MFKSSHNTAQGKGSCRESGLLNSRVSHCPEGRRWLHFKAPHWIGKIARTAVSSPCVIQLAAGPVQTLQKRHHPSLLVILNNTQNTSYLNYAKRLLYKATPASAGTVSTDYVTVPGICTIWLVLQEEPPGHLAGAVQIPSQHRGRACPLIQAQREVLRRISKTVQKSHLEPSFITSSTLLRWGLGV